LSETGLFQKQNQKLTLKPDNFCLKLDNLGLKLDNHSLKPDNLSLKPDNFSQKLGLGFGKVMTKKLFQILVSLKLLCDPLGSKICVLTFIVFINNYIFSRLLQTFQKIRPVKFELLNNGK